MAKVNSIIYALLAVACLLLLYGTTILNKGDQHESHLKTADLHNTLRDEISKALHLINKIENMNAQTSEVHSVNSNPVFVSPVSTVREEIMQSAVISKPVEVEPSQPVSQSSASQVAPRPVSQSVIEATDARLAIIRKQKYNHLNPFHQDKRPDLFVYPSKPYPSPLTSSDDVTKSVDAFLVKARAAVQRQRGGCAICVEHFVAAEELWTKFIKPRFYANTAAAGAAPYTGVYLEMGALDGISGSNSLFFDEALHWDGLLIEPSPPNYANLVVNRPFALKVEVAACPCATGPSHVCDLEFVSDGGGVGGGRDSLKPREQKLRHGPPKVTYNVACAPMSEIFRLAGITRVDFWSLDNEGAELITLQTVDWTAVKVWLMLIEFNPIFDNGPAMTAELQKAGFRFVMNQGTMNQLWENPNYFNE